MVVDFTYTIDGLSIEYDGTASGGTGDYSYSWEFWDTSPTELLDTNSGLSGSYLFDSSGLYQVKFIVNDGESEASKNLFEFFISP